MINMKGFFLAHSQNVQPDDLLDGHQSRSCALLCYELGLRELVTWTKNVAKRGRKAKDKSHRMGFFGVRMLLRHLHAWQQ